MKRQNHTILLLLGVGLLTVSALVACKPSGDSLEERISQLSAQIAELKATNADLKMKFDKDQIAKNSRLSAIEGKMEDLAERLTTRGK